MTHLQKGLWENDTTAELTGAAEDCAQIYESLMHEDYGDCLLGIEDEFVVQGVHYSQKQELRSFLTDTLSEKYGAAFGSLDDEHPLMRVKASVDAGQNGAVEIPDLFRLELVTDHMPLNSHDGLPVHLCAHPSDVVNKARMLAEMRLDIWDAVEEFQEGASVTWNPRPVSDIYDYLTKSSGMDEDDILSDIKSQARAREDLIGRDAILKANSLDEILLGENAIINNEGAAGSGVHINIGFTGKDGVNPFYNPDAIDSGTPVTWNACAGVMDATAESVLPFINLRDSSWKRIGNPHLSTADEVRYHPLKKGGAIIQQSPYSQSFYEAHGVPYKMTANENNVHIEVRHCDGGAGIRDGSALITLQLATILGSMHRGLKNDNIHSHDELMEYRRPIAQDYDEAVESFKTSKYYRGLLGDRLHNAVIDHVEEFSRSIEEAYTDLPDVTEDCAP